MESTSGCVRSFPSLSWLAASSQKALTGIRQVVAEAVQDMKENGDAVPLALADKRYSGEFRIRIPPHVHRALAVEAAEQGVSLNRLASAKLSA
jgi:predicted HicB family RNase H-like nuclease